MYIHHQNQNNVIVQQNFVIVQYNLQKVAQPKARLYENNVFCCVIFKIEFNCVFLFNF